MHPTLTDSTGKHTLETYNGNGNGVKTVAREIVLNLVDSGTECMEEGCYFCTEHACQAIAAKRAQCRSSNSTDEGGLVRAKSAYELIDESFEIEVSVDVIVVTARSCRGILFGLGRLLRNCILG